VAAATGSFAALGLAVFPLLGPILEVRHLPLVELSPITSVSRWKLMSSCTAVSLKLTANPAQLPRNRTCLLPAQQRGT